MMVRINKERKTLQETVFWYKSILDAVPLPISVTDVDSNWKFINSRVEEFLGVKFEDIKEKPCSNWGANICNTPNCGIECAKRGVNQTYFTHNGASYKVDVEVLKGINGETAGYIEVVQDITQLEEVSKKQISAEVISKAKTSFIATVSHEIRTPMNAIIGITDIEMQDQTISQKTREALIKIHNSGDLLLHIINDILDLSKIEASKLEIIPDNYYVPSLINDTVHLNILRINNKPIEFDLHLSENIPTMLLGDEIRIKQILNNLLSNAFKYTEKGNVTLSISAEDPGEQENADITLVFIISDTGMGMTNEDINNLFNEYTRFQLETNRTTEGTGLGMSITKHLVRLMNGEIYVESALGSGSTFTVRLPQKKVNSFILGKELVESLQSFQYDSSPLAKKTQITREPMPYGRVLIVDDVETNLYVAKGLMVPYDLKIELASSGFEAIDKIINGSKYDIIFMDHMMPKMDGMEAVKIIRENNYKDTIVALTANAVVGQAEIFKSNGFDDFISKPIDIRQLNTILNKFIRDKQPEEVREKAKRNRTVSSINSSAQPQSISEEILKYFLKDAKNSMLIIEEAVRNDFNSKEDIKNYIINVHAMKSALANIGEYELSGIARDLEQIARENKIEEISAKTAAFIDLLLTVIMKISNISYKNKTENTEDDNAFLRQRLLDIQEACSSFDKKSAKKSLKQLKERMWTQNVDIILDNISEYLLHSEFEKVSALIKDYLFSFEL